VIPLGARACLRRDWVTEDLPSIFGRLARRPFRPASVIDDDSRLGPIHRPCQHGVGSPLRELLAGRGPSRAAASSPMTVRNCTYVRRRQRLSTSTRSIGSARRVWEGRGGAQHDDRSIAVFYDWEVDDLLGERSPRRRTWSTTKGLASLSTILRRSTPRRVAPSRGGRGNPSSATLPRSATPVPLLSGSLRSLLRPETMNLLPSRKTSLEPVIPEGDQEPEQGVSSAGVFPRSTPERPQDPA